MRKALILVLLAGGCAATVPAPQPAAGERCVALFRAYDATAETMSTPSGRSDRMPIPPRLQRPVQELRAAGCLTPSDALDLAVAAPPVADGGAAIAPTALHAGVVTTMADDAAAQGFFEAHGAPARSIGAPGLGRRIYLGPFATEGALAGAAALARPAGFVAPYPVRP